jgi:hypothetical protein
MANLQTDMFVVKSYLVGSHAPSNLAALAVAIAALSPPPRCHCRHPPQVRPSQ